LVEQIDMSEKITQNGYEPANYDLDSAVAMLKASRYLYIVFLCQQAIKKNVFFLGRQKNALDIYIRTAINWPGFQISFLRFSGIVLVSDFR